MRFFIRCGLLRGQVLAPSARLEAVAIWYRSSDLAFGLNTVIRAGAASVLRGLGWSTFTRLKELGDAKKAHRDRIMQEKYWFLDVIGVDSAHARRGFGRSLIEPKLAQADREDCACYLETSDRNNLGIYERFGFRLRSTYRFRDLETFCLARTPEPRRETDSTALSKSLPCQASATA
jgi:ribosomal protein S18 acetylase RimI-like enzyme